MIVSDVRGGGLVRTMRRLHSGHINVLKFLHNSPDLFVTSSYDGSAALWDLREVWHRMVWNGVAWHRMVWYVCDMAWYGVASYGLVWIRMVWYGIVWCGMVWHGMV